MIKSSMAAIAALGLAGAAMAAPPPAEFVKMAGASDLYEITSSKLVMNSSDPKIKAFATQMVTDHNNSTAMVKAAAMKSGITPKPPKLDAKGAANVAALKRVSGAERDRLYVTQQKASHQEALALHQDNAATSTAPALKDASAKIVPVVQHHVMELDAM